MSSQTAPPPGLVHLILSRPKDQEPFYLEIPISIITTLCQKPRKYVRYLGWCVLGAVGTLADHEGNEITLDGDLEDQGVYQYLLPSGTTNTLAHAVDLEVIKQRSEASDTTTTRDDFRNTLLERDGGCVWSGVHGEGMHIIPYSRGDEWLRRIIANRPGCEDEDAASFTINDFRNGICANSVIHKDHFRPREVVVLKTPNPILEPTDVPARHQRNLLHSGPGVSYPDDTRYTMQWLVARAQAFLSFMPNNNDATFVDQSLPKPADVLLHYNYGAAAVKHWGKNVGVLANRPDRPRPTKPKPKRADTSGKAVASGGWDEDDVMLYFWGNSKAAQERHAQKEQERTEYMEKWRDGVV